MDGDRRDVPERTVPDGDRVEVRVSGVLEPVRVAMTMVASVVARSQIWSAWQAEPAVIATAFAGAVLYGAGYYATGIKAVSPARAAAFVAGIVTVLLALLSPLGAA